MAELKEWMEDNYKDYLVTAARNIKQYCITHSCCDCPFHDVQSLEECAISSRDYLDVTYPQTWEVL